MDAKAEITRFLKDVQASAKEFATYGLQMSAKALDTASARLKGLEKKLTPEETAAAAGETQPHDAK
jgi:hypothetical protein